MKNKNILNGITFISFLLILISCKKENQHGKSSTVPQGNSNATARSLSPDDFLTFDNVREFDSTLNVLLESSIAVLDAWEASNNFFSMRKAFNELVDAEAELSERFDNLSQDSIDYWSSQPIQHSAVLNDYTHMVLTETYNDTSFFVPNIHNYNFSFLVNTYGVVKVGGIIYQYTRDYIKYIDNGDQSHIATMLAATTSDSSNHIVVRPIHSEISAYARPDRIMQGTSTFVKSNITTNGRYRVIVYQDWVQNTSATDPLLKVTKYTVRVRSLKRRLWGLWYDNHKEWLTSTGNFSGNSTWGVLADNTTHYTINWTGSFNVAASQSTHTFDFYLPWNQGFTTSMYQLRTDGYHPELYSSSITGNAVNVQGTTTYP